MVEAAIPASKELPFTPRKKKQNLKVLNCMWYF